MVIEFINMIICQLLNHIFKLDIDEEMRKVFLKDIKGVYGFDSY